MILTIAVSAIRRILAHSATPGKLQVEESEYSEGPQLWEHDYAYTTAPGTVWYLAALLRGTGARPISGAAPRPASVTSTSRQPACDGLRRGLAGLLRRDCACGTAGGTYMGVASTVQNRPSNPDGEYFHP